MIDTLEPVTNQHRLVINSQVVWDDMTKHSGDAEETGLHRQLFHQYTRVTRERKCLRHDDRLDVLAIAVNYWTESAAIDADEMDSRAVHKAMVARQKETRKNRVRINGRKGQSKRQRHKNTGRTGGNLLQ